jgi:hypothetical protein
MIRRHLISSIARRSTAAAAGAAAAPARFLSTASDVSRRHVIAALVVNQPGCLAEIANLFAARGAFPSRLLRLGCAN